MIVSLEMDKHYTDILEYVKEKSKTLSKDMDKMEEDIDKLQLKIKDKDKIKDKHTSL